VFGVAEGFFGRHGFWGEAARCRRSHLNAIQKP
jgi:hypothetical protein